MSFDEVIPRFNECVHLLEEIVDSKVIGFRAGGYSIQNFNLFADLLNSNGIKIDSSVLSRAELGRHEIIKLIIMITVLFRIRLCIDF